MKHVGKRKVLISVVAMMLALVFTGAAFADSYPSPVFFLPSVNSRPEPTTAPEETATPEASNAPEELASPEATTTPEVTVDPNATATPEVTADPNTTATPEATVDPNAIATPEATVDPNATATPEATVGPNATATPEVTAAPNATPTPEATVDPNVTVTPEPTPAPTISYLRDEAGNLILDLNAAPIPIVPEGMQAPVEYLRNENGAYILDENGNPIPAALESTPEPTLEPQPTPAFSFTYERDEAGSLVLDENGNPIAIITEGMTEMPVAFQRDANGALVLDENGNPIPAAMVPVNAQKLQTLADLLDPNRSIDIYIDWGGGQLCFGDTVMLAAVLHGYENAVYTMQWQQSPDDATWTDIPGETQDRMYVTVTQDNYANYWRVMLEITDVIVPAEAE